MDFYYQVEHPISIIVQLDALSMPYGSPPHSEKVHPDSPACLAQEKCNKVTICYGTRITQSLL